MATATQTTDNKMNGQAIAARADAVKSLITAHAEEFGKILAEERTKRGLSPVGGGESTKALEERIKKYEEKMEKAKAALAERGVSA